MRSVEQTCTLKAPGCPQTAHRFFPVNLLDQYHALEGSHGTIRLVLDQSLLDRLCSLVTDRFKGRVHNLRITPTGENRFRIQAELSNWFYQFFGSLGLYALRQDGIEIQINYPTASGKNPTIEGSMDTTVFGRDLAIPRLVEAINEGLGAGEVVEVMDSEWVGWTQFRVFVSVQPFRLLRKYLPAAIGDHITRVRWQTTETAFYFDFTWEHTGTEEVVLTLIKENNDG